MKKTLEEERKRILEISKILTESHDYGFEDLNDDSNIVSNEVLIQKLENAIGMKEWSLVQEVLDDLKNQTNPSDDEELRKLNAQVYKDPRGFGYGYTNTGSPDDVKI